MASNGTANVEFQHEESLIRRLYSGAARPDEIQAIQARLQERQREPDGWQLANALLCSDEPNVRFFGALTFVVKINQEPLSVTAALEVLIKLLEWVITRTESEETSLVLNKLSSALITLFLQPQTEWGRPVRHLLCCFASHKVVPTSSIEGQASNDVILSALSELQLTAMLTFVTTLAQDANKVPRNTEYSSCHEALTDSVEDVVDLLRLLIHGSVGRNVMLQQKALTAYQAWIAYARESFSRTSDQQRALASLMGPLMVHLSQDEMFEQTAEFCIDVLTAEEDALMAKDQTDVISHMMSMERFRIYLEDLPGDPVEEAITFARLVLAFAQANVASLVSGQTRLDWMMSAVHYITRSQNSDNVDQSLAGAICDFWEYYTIEAPPFESDNDNKAREKVEKEWLQGVQELCEAASLPLDSHGQFRTPGSESPFSEFRGRVQSAVQASYDDFGVAVLRKLVDVVVAAGAQAANLPVVEVALYCLADISTSMEYSASDKTEENALLEQLFRSEVFGSLSKDTVPVRLKKRAIGIIGDQEAYFVSQPQQLLSTLDLLFGTLGHPLLMETSASAIRNLAESGRTSLSQVAPQLLTAAASVLEAPSASGTVAQNMIRACSATAQAMPEQSTEQLQALDRIISLILERQRRNSSGVDAQEALRESAIARLEELACMAEGLQPSQSGPIHVLDDEVAEASTPAQAGYDGINQRVLEAIARLLDPRDDGSLLAAACQILKVGYKEQAPGYFRFAPDVTANLVTTTPHSNPRLDEAIKTASFFLSSASGRNAATNEAKLQLVHFIAEVITSIGPPQNDPILASACVSFVSKLVPIHLHLFRLMSEPAILNMLSFTIQCLRSPEGLAKAPAMDMWNAFSGMNVQQDAVLSMIFQQFGRDLIKVLVFGFGGDASRSELPQMARTFAKLKMRQPNIKRWTEEALTSPDFPSERVSLDDRRRFLNQLMSADERTTERVVVRDFWTRSRGTLTSYN